MFFSCRLFSTPQLTGSLYPMIVSSRRQCAWRCTSLNGDISAAFDSATIGA